MMLLKVILFALLGVCQASIVYETLVQAAQIGDLATLTKYISDKAEVEWKYKKDPPLHVAAVNGQLLFAKMLLDAGVNPELKDYRGYRVLTKAVQTEHVEIVKLLVEYGANIYEVDEVDELPYNILQTAASNGNLNVVQYLLSLGMNINEESKEKNTPLIMASLNGHHDIVSYLLDQGADIEFKNEQGNTALLAASYKNQSRVVVLLLSRGGDASIQNMDKASPVILAARGNYHKVLYELLKAGANPNDQDIKLNCPLTLCGRSGHMECLRHLVQFGADLEITDEMGHTAYALALNNNHREAQKFLALSGASHASTSTHDGVSAINIPKIFTCFWFKGVLKRFQLSQKQTKGEFVGRKACDYLSQEMNLKGSIVKLLDMVNYYGYTEVTKRLQFDSFLPPSFTAEHATETMSALFAKVKEDLKSMHSKDYKEYFRVNDEEEMEKSLPATLRKFGADIPEDKKEGDLDLAAIAAERTTKRQVHRASKEERPEHMKGALGLDDIQATGKGSKKRDVEGGQEQALDEL